MPTKKLIEDAAVLCSAMAGMYQCEETDWMLWSEVYEVLGHEFGDPVQRLAWAASASARHENIDAPFAPGLSWALACSLLLNGEVRP